MTKILVATEKHYIRYFDATTTEQLHAAALKLLNERVMEAFFDVGRPPLPPDVFGLNLDSLPESIRLSAQRQTELHQQRMRQYEEEKIVSEEAKLALETQDGKLAWEILQYRSRYEYEQVSLEECEEV